MCCSDHVTSWYQSSSTMSYSFSFYSFIVDESRHPRPVSRVCSVPPCDEGGKAVSHPTCPLVIVILVYILHHFLFNKVWTVRFLWYKIVITANLHLSNYKLTRYFAEMLLNLKRQNNEEPTKCNNLSLPWDTICLFPYLFPLPNCPTCLSVWRSPSCTLVHSFWHFDSSTHCWLKLQRLGWTFERSST